MLLIIYACVSMYLCHFLIGFLGIILVEEWHLMSVNGRKRFLVLLGIKWEEKL